MNNLLSLIEKFGFSGGKTVALNTLAEAQTHIGMKTSLYTLNPKALNVIELYGVLDPLTRRFVDLVLICTLNLWIRR